MDKSEYTLLLERFVKKCLSTDKEAEIREWFLSEESAGELDVFFRERWQATKDMPVSRDIQLRMLTSIREKMGEQRASSKSVRLQWRWMQYAASIILCIGIGAIIGAGFLWNSRRQLAEHQPAEVKEYTVMADKGQRAKVVLPDGTEVWINSHSKLTYTNEYGLKNRQVSLIGEAFFEVAKDSLHRFIVNAGEMEVEALGTSFNVKAYQEDRDITTTLFTGAVRTATGAEAYTLSPNQYMTFNRSNRQTTIGEADPLYARMWMDNELVFKGQTMGEIAVILNRISNVHVTFATEKVKRYRFSGVIKNNSLDNILEIISLTAPITYQSEGDTIMLSEKP